MKRDIALWQFVGFSFVSIMGTLLHFLYDWTGGNFLASLISGVNESTWEHMKLLYFPMFIFALIQCSYFKEYKNFWCAKLIGIATGLTSIPVLFYTYNGTFGKSPDYLNIAIFFISAAAVFILETYLLKKDIPQCKRTWGAFTIICIIGIIFVVFTFATPQIPLFLDPLSGSYGI